MFGSVYGVTGLIFCASGNALNRADFLRSEVVLS